MGRGRIDAATGVAVERESKQLCGVGILNLVYKSNFCINFLGIFLFLANQIFARHLLFSDTYELDI